MANSAINPVQNSLALNRAMGLGSNINTAIAQVAKPSLNNIFGEQNNTTNLAQNYASTLPSYSEIARSASQKAMDSVSNGTVGVDGKLRGNAQAYASQGVKGNRENNALTYTTTSADEAKKAIATNAAQNTQRINTDGSVNPYVNPNFDDFKNYGKHELEGYFGNLDAIRQQGMGGSTLPPAVMHDMSKDSEFQSILTKGDNGLSQEKVENLWNRTSEIIGAVFEKGTDKFETAAISTLQKFEEAGLGELMKKDGVTVHDQAEVLSHAMKNNMSVSGMKDFGGVYDAYLGYRDNIANAGIIRNSTIDQYNQTGTVAQGEKHGIQDMASTEKMKNFANEVFQDGFDKMVTAMGYDAAEVNKVAGEEIGLNGKTNHDPSLMAAVALSHMMGKEDTNGATGWDKLVEQSRERDGDPKTKYDANGYISIMHDSQDLKTDGTAFVRSEGGLLGLDALSTMHSGGLRNNPMAPNTLAFGYQGDGSSNAITQIEKNIKSARESGIAVNGFDNLAFAPSGHGGPGGSILSKSGFSDLDKTNVGLENVPQIAKMLVDNTRDGGTIRIDCDACFGAAFGKPLNDAVQKYASENDRNIASTYFGSIEEGAMLSNSLGETVNGGDTRVLTDATGSAQVVKIRGDLQGAGNIDGGKLQYSKGKDQFNTAAAEIKKEKELRAESVDSQSSQSSGVEASKALLGDARSEKAPVSLSQSDISNAWGIFGAKQDTGASNTSNSVTESKASEAKPNNQETADTNQTETNKKEEQVAQAEKQKEPEKQEATA